MLDLDKIEEILKLVNRYKVFVIIIKGNVYLNVLEKLVKLFTDKFNDIKFRIVYIKPFYFEKLEDAKKFLDVFYGEEVKNKIIENFNKFYGVRDKKGALNLVAQELVNKPFFLVLLALDNSIYELEDILRYGKNNVIGPTDPSKIKNSEKFVRGVSILDSLENSGKRRGYIWNLVHFPSSVEENLDNILSMILLNILTLEELEKIFTLYSMWLEFENKLINN